MESCLAVVHKLNIIHHLSLPSPYISSPNENTVDRRIQQCPRHPCPRPSLIGPSCRGGFQWRFLENYPRDLDWARSGTSRFAALRLMAKICFDLPRLRGFDIVQFINPVLPSSRQSACVPSIVTSVATTNASSSVPWGWIGFGCTPARMKTAPL